VPPSVKTREKRRSTCCSRGSNSVDGGISSIVRFALQVAAPTAQSDRLRWSDGAIAAFATT
jgi:hypothetical protein